jgi:predicted CXXCH cytochrome family protein
MLTMSRRRAGLCRAGGALLVLALWLTGHAAAQSGTGQPLVGEVVQTFALAGDDAMHMPTDVVVDAAGHVFVADGVNRRIVVFAADGSVLARWERVGKDRLENPLALDLGPDGALWITDPGRGRVFAAHTHEIPPLHGVLKRSLQIAVDDAAIDLAGLHVDATGTRLWLSSNDFHEILTLDLQTDEVRRMGQLGESLGAFHYPYLMAGTPAGEVLVVDVLNGRVQVLSRDGVPAGSVGSYGVGVGQLYRPKGVAVDPDGVVWVSDGTLNVLQAFTFDGRLVGVLRDAGGEPLRFALPMGMTFDSAGDLYVVELNAHRVLKLSVRRDPDVAPPSRLERRRTGTSGPQARFCTACHFEWMTPLADGRATTLADVPPNPPEYPWVSREPTCLGCHDGSVGDARRRVWVQHGHQVGIVPPTSVSVPADLPLADGKIRCRTCHSAHSLPESRTTIEEIVFLRVTKSPAELCLGCHSDRDGGLAAGMHPLGAMPDDVPAALIHLPAVQTREQVTCLACHTGHGAAHDDLLVLSPDDNTLCLACHEQLQSQMFADDVRSAHGHQPELTAAQVVVAEGFGTRIGPDDELLCATCHASHNARPGAHLLAFDPAAQDTCAACHADRAGVVGSPHDLRTNHPDVPNVVGITAAEEGACAGCHTAHRDARVSQPTPLDPAGQCANCHQSGGLAEDALLGDVNHPEAACKECHEPHTSQFGDFLRDAPQDLCRSCHEEYAISGGPHDLQRDPELWPAASQEAADGCLACHRPHGNDEVGLLRAGRLEIRPAADGACLACHAEAQPDHAGSRLSLLHPRRPGTAHPAHLPEVMGADGEAWIGCRTCHDPHGGADAAVHLLRLDPGVAAENICFDCHPERANIHMIGHAELPLREAGFEVGGCRPCHATHADPRGVSLKDLWPKALDEFPGVDDVPIANRHCRACHRADGPIPAPEIASHPEVEMFNPLRPEDPGYMPLFNAAGERDPMGTIACRTCHLTHGRSAPAPLPPGADPTTSRELRARAWHVRTFGAANVCTTCHGFDGLRRFMYFHTPERRGGPIEGGLP